MGEIQMWCMRRAAWSASQPRTCRASWPSERCPSCWSWCSSCGRRSRASCPRSFLWMETGYSTTEALGWPATLASLQTCRVLGWPRNFCRWMGWRTTPCTRRSETLAVEGAVDTPSCFTGWQILRAETASLIPPSSQIRLLQTQGDSFPLLGDSGTVLGMALRSHDRSTRPLYISVGHRMSLEAAVRLTRCCCRFRIPEPVRQADICSREHIRKSLGLPGPPTPRSPKAQRPVACPKGDSGESSGEGQPPQDHSPGPRTAPRPGSQEQAGKDWQ
uniref:Endonuclease V n=1 Tax=Gorilla gorilla gorilla TaxID=9595 RepID=A0A2I2ZTS0_GORGO